MLFRQLPLPDLLLADPEVAWNFWLVLNELSELLWERHEHLFLQWARDDFGGFPAQSPQAAPGPFPTSRSTSDWPLAASSSPSPGPPDHDPITDDDIPF